MSVPRSSSPHALQSAVRRVARGEKRLLLVHGWASFATVALGTVLLAGLTDYLFRLRDPGLRWGLTGLVLAAAIYWFRRRVWPVLSFQRDDISTAQRIETCFPQVGDRLSNAIAFLETTRPSAAAGSPKLRQVVVDRAWSELQRLPLPICLTTRASARALFRLAAIVLVALGVLLADPATCRLAAQRLILPWGDLPWPRRHELQFVETPRYLGPGQDFEATVEDRRGELPDMVTIQYWFDGDAPSQVQSRTMRFSGGNMVHRIANVQRPFRYRAIGGDDDAMDWIDLSLVEPPQLSSVQVQVTPPDYLGAVPYETAGPVVALSGSRLTWQGRADQELSEARLHVDPSEALEDETSPPWSAEVGTDRETFRLPAGGDEGFRLKQSGSYWFELIDAQRRTFSIPPSELQVRVDQPPNVRLLPISRDGIVTPEARVELTIVVEDDFALESVELRVARSAGEQLRVPVWTRPAPPSDVSLMPPPPPDAHRLVHILNLPDFQLQPGEILDLVAVGSDYLPQTGSSSEQRLRVVSREEFEQRFAQQQSELAAKILESIRLQQSARSQTESVRVELEESGQVERADLDRLQSAELNQRRIPQLIAEDHDSIVALVQQAHQELERNQLDRPDVSERLGWLEGELQRLAAQDLPAVQRELLEAIKLAPDDLSTAQPLPDRQADSLQRAVQGQRETLESLEEIARQLGEWESYRRFAQEAQQLWQEQERIRENTESLQPRTLGRDPRELASPERAALKRLEQQQSDLTRRWEHFLERLTEKENSLAESEPELAENLAAGSELARERNVSGTLRDTVRRLEQNQLGQAAEGQRTASDSLQQVAQTLSGMRPDSAEDSGAAAERRQAQRDARQQLREQLQLFFTGVSELEVRQDQLRTQTVRQVEQMTDNSTESAAAEAIEPLGKQQRDLAEDSDSLQSLVVHSPLLAWQLERATIEMSAAAGRLDELAPERAAAHQERATRRLRDLLRAVEPLTDRETPEPGAEGDEPSSDEPDDDSDTGPRLGLEELRLLRLLQMEVLEQTKQLAERMSREEGVDGAESEVTHGTLAAEQEKLARLLMELMGNEAESLDDLLSDDLFGPLLDPDQGQRPRERLDPRQQQQPPQQQKQKQKQKQKELLDELDEQLFPR